MSPAARLAVNTALLTAAYVASGRIGLMLDAVEGFASLVWPPSGIALAALVLYGRNLWPGVAIGALVVNVWNGAPLLVALGIAAGNTLEAVLGAFVLTRIKGFQPSLERIKDVLGLVMTACFTTLVAATVGPLCLVLGGLVDAANYGLVWQAWWTGDLIAELVVAPLLLTWGAPRSQDAPVRPKETFALALCLLAVGFFVFGPVTPGSLSGLRHPNLFLPVLAWAAIRLGPRGLTAAAFAGSVMTVAGTLAGYGPFDQKSGLNAVFLELKLYLPLVVATFLALASATAERSALLRRERAARLEAERAVQARDDFLAIAAHELATPLTPLRLELEQLQRGIDSSKDVSILQRRIDRASRQTDRLARLTERLLDVSRIASGRIALEPTEFDFCEMVRETIDEFRDEATRAGTEITLSAPDAVVGRWDRLRAAQVVSNLLSNAVKHANGQPIAVSVSDRSDAVVLDVADRGPGIDAASLPRIFERFERAAPERRRGGLGLGLYMAREIARAHHGTITVTSEAGSGSTFTVSLPRGD